MFNIIRVLYDISLAFYNKRYQPLCTILQTESRRENLKIAIKCNMIPLVENYYQFTF